MSSQDTIVVGYVDESQMAASDFSGEMPKNFEIIEIIVKHEEPLEHLLDRIMAAGLDYLVVDYHLRQDILVEYNGDDVIAAYTKAFKDFPSMLLTSNARGAIEHSEDISLSIIRDKTELVGEQKDLIVLQIAKSVEEYRKRVADAERRYKELLDKRDVAGLNHNEENEATELNELIDQSLGGGDDRPLIDITSGERLIELIQKTDELIKKIEANGQV